jgi:hypothetical protein
MVGESFDIIQKQYEGREYKKALKNVDVILKKYPRNGGAQSSAFQFNLLASQIHLTTILRDIGHEGFDRVRLVEEGGCAQAASTEGEG